jgi:hypothetical protein
MDKPNISKSKFLAGEIAKRAKVDKNDKKHPDTQINSKCNRTTQKCQIISQNSPMKSPQKSPTKSPTKSPIISQKSPRQLNSPYGNNNSKSFNHNGGLYSPYGNNNGQNSPIRGNNNNKIPSSPYKDKSPSILKSPIAIKVPSSPYKMESPTSITLNRYENIWLYKPRKNETITKFAGIDKDGNISSVPTADYKLPPSTQFAYNDKTNIDDDFITIGDIFLDKKGSKGQSYHFVAENMRNITAQIKQCANLREQYINEFKEYDLRIKGRVTLEKFEELLDIYENNQVYFQECLENGALTYNEICEGLTKLEYWFICIIQPYDKDEDGDYEDCKERERSKLTKGYSGYCDPDLYFYIQQPLPEKIVDYIEKQHKRYY